MSCNIAVSVIIPVYNAAPYLRQCLDSIVNQTLRDIEVICVDDASTDGSFDILREYECTDKRMRLIVSEDAEPCGPGFGRNRGLDSARGRYIYFIDADDFIELYALEALTKYADETDADVVMFGAFLYDHDLNVVKNIYFPEKTWANQQCFSGEDVSDHLFSANSGSVWNKIFKRKFLNERGLRFPAGRYAYEDKPFLYAAFALAGRIAVLDRYLYYYRQFSDGRNRSAQWAKYNPCLIYESMLILKSLLIRNSVYDTFRRSYVNCALSLQLYELSMIAQWHPKIFDQKWRSLCDSQFTELDIADHQREYFYISAHYSWLQLITSNEPSEYVFYEMRMIGIDNPPFPMDRVARGSDIVLYGAGRLGRKYHEWLSCSKYCNVALWLDRRAEELWPPISEPAAIGGTRYNHVIIAVGDPDAAREIGNDLVKSYGIDPTRLIYVS